MKDDFDSSGFAAALNRARLARGVTWADISAATDVSQTTLSRIQSGERRPDAAAREAIFLCAVEVGRGLAWR